VGGPITLQPTDDGGVEAVVPLASLAELLNAAPKEIMVAGAGFSNIRRRRALRSRDLKW
jgi:hypothetical protein